MDRARARLIVDTFSRNYVPTFYSILVRQVHKASCPISCLAESLTASCVPHTDGGPPLADASCNSNATLHLAQA